MSQTIKEQLLKLFRGVWGKSEKTSDSCPSPRKSPQVSRGVSANQSFSQGKSWIRRNKPQKSPLVSLLQEHDLKSQLTTTQTRAAPSSKSSNHKKTYIAGIAADARLNLAGGGILENYKLLSDETLGIDSRFDDNSTEIKIGLDFGTSTVKVVAKTDTDFIASNRGHFRLPIAYSIASKGRRHFYACLRSACQSVGFETSIT